MTEASPRPQRLTLTQWSICFIASVGFAFDIYELLMLPLIVKPALAALGGASPGGGPLLIPGSPEFTHWARLLFFVPALAGGVFGLLGGYLTDRLGRRRVLTGSILLYAFSAFASGFATTPMQLLVLRCLVFIGVCVEFVAAVAWLAELFPEPKRREKVLGYTQAFSSLGGLLVALANKGCIAWAEVLPAIHGTHEAWRYTLISGLVPAIPLLLIRPFLPESPVWQQKRAAGTLKRPSFAELFRPAYRRTTIVTTILFACSYAIAFGALQHLPQIVPGMADVKAGAAAEKARLQGEAASRSAAEPAPNVLAAAGRRIEEGAAATVQTWQEVGGMLGRLALAALAVWIVGRRALFRVFQIPCLLIVPLLFAWIGSNLDSPGNLGLIKWGVLLAGVVTVAQFSFWGNYLPRVYPVHLRGTGESFAANIGGRVFGTYAAWITLTLSASTPPSPSRIAWTAAGVAGAA
ncbi:MAG TPA: MFS transporter, partial [Candidatus Polarisedimenticolia bacterium]|nr:MFS transporter [Candidatus Polarisedimenticolia bacterium]